MSRRQRQAARERQFRRAVALTAREMLAASQNWGAPATHANWAWVTCSAAFAAERIGLDTAATGRIAERAYALCERLYKRSHPVQYWGWN